MNSITDAKRKLRNTMLARRAGRAPGERAAAADRLKDRFMSGIALSGPAIVSGYWPMDDEMDVRPLMSDLEAAGCRLALPVVAGKGRPLSFRAWRSGQALVKAGFGLSEPSADSPEVTPEILLVPMLAFDASGNRLGFGGGFYDMTLSALRAANPLTRAVGVAFSDQQADHVPHDDTDQRLDAVVTEKDVLAFATPAASQE